LVAMSGGVDSSVAAALLLEKGYEVEGIFMKFWQPGIVSPLQKNNGENVCCSRESWRQAKKVARKLGFKIKAVDLSAQFKQQVVDEFLGWQRLGLTPNPCIVCNQKIKFGELMKLADQAGADLVATGHYARVINDSGKLELRRGKDKKKDQSYFLYKLTSAQLARVVFPVGEIRKDEVRSRARSLDLPVADQKESQEVCFIPDNNQVAFLTKFLRSEMKPGDIVTTTGKVIGKHVGLPAYTIGQRRGIKIGGIGPFYVVRKDFGQNKLVVTKDEQNLMSRKLTLLDTHWIGEAPSLPVSCQTQIRYRSPATEAVVQREKDEIVVKLKSAQRAITPGQAAVFYDDDRVLGGGVIRK